MAVIAQEGSILRIDMAYFLEHVLASLISLIFLCVWFSLLGWLYVD
jgi:hypothetical protein